MTFFVKNVKFLPKKGVFLDKIMLKLADLGVFAKRFSIPSFLTIFLFSS